MQVLLFRFLSRLYLVHVLCYFVLTFFMLDYKYFDDSDDEDGDGDKDFDDDDITQLLLLITNNYAHDFNLHLK